MSGPGLNEQQFKKKILIEQKRKTDTGKLTLESKNYVDGDLYNY